MTETAHETDDAFHEIQLSGKQLVFAFMVTTLIAIAIFLLGVKVGRDGRSERAAAADAPETIAAAPSPAAAPAQPVASSGPPAAEPPAPAPEPEDELSYAKRLQSDSTPAEKLASRAPAPPAPKPEPKTPPAAAKAASAPPAAASRPGAWIVQVISLQDRAAAATIARRLTGKGYPAFVLDPSAGAPRIYRVQVGGYADKSEAEQAARRLEKDEQFKPLVRSR